MSLLRAASLAVPQIRRLRDQRNALIAERGDLVAARDALAAERDHLLGEAAKHSLLRQNSPFFHYNTIFDPIAVIRRHAAPGLQPSPGYLTNYLGVRTDPKFFPTLLQDRAGEVEDVPIPGNWHADIAEWGAVLRAVELARDSFTIIELGCGWGCWLNNAGVAARRRGLAVQLVGVEGDESHIGFAREACATNGFSPDQVTLHRGIAAARDGMALFPRQDIGGEHWGLEPVFGASEEERQAAAASGRFDELPMIALETLIAPHPRIDLLHIDIQGGEYDLLAGTLAVCKAKVAYIFVGTHSRSLEGRIMDMMLAEGWVPEIERPAILKLDDGKPYTLIDGVQGWRNKALLPL
jgi:hypothetical protein